MYDTGYVLALLRHPVLCGLPSPNLYVLSHSSRERLCTPPVYTIFSACQIMLPQNLLRQAEKTLKLIRP